MLLGLPDTTWWVPLLRFEDEFWKLLLKLVDKAAVELPLVAMSTTKYVVVVLVTSCTTSTCAEWLTDATGTTVMVESMTIIESADAVSVAKVGVAVTVTDTDSRMAVVAVLAGSVTVS